MKKSSYSDEQIFRDVDSVPITEVAKRHGVSDASIYAGRKSFGEMVSDNVKRLKALEVENSRLKKLVAERYLKIGDFRKKMVYVQVRREQARYAISRSLSQRRACALIHVSRANLGYVRKMPGKNDAVAETMRRLSGEYPRFGACRIRIMLGREGIIVGKERCGRLWAQMPASTAQAAALHCVLLPRPLAPNTRNAVWSYDFVFDAFANGQQLKCLTVVDEYTRECLAIDVHWIDSLLPRHRGIEQIDQCSWRTTVYAK